MSHESGRQEGFTVEKREGVKGPSFMARIWSVTQLRYVRSKTFAARRYRSARDAERAAIAWAKEQVTASRALLPGAADGGSGGRCDTRRALALYLEDRSGRGGNATQLANVRRRLEALPRHCPDLGGEDAGKQVYAWWREWCDEPCAIGGRPGQPLPTDRPARAKSIRTRNNGLTDGKAFLHWCWKAKALTGLRAPVDCDWIEPLRAPQNVRPQFTLDELRTGLRAAAHPFRIRWALYAYLGARLREVLALRWADFQGGHVLLSGKGKKQRLVPVPPELAVLLRLHRRRVGDHDGYLFPDQVRRADSGTLAKRFDGFLVAAGIAKDGRSAHSLRHCYAGLMTATGEPTALLQAYMGHSQADMTRHYAQMAARYRDQVRGWERGELRLLGQRARRPG